jgi:hypothetical protein
MASRKPPPPDNDESQAERFDWLLSPNEDEVVAAMQEAGFGEGERVRLTVSLVEAGKYEQVFSDSFSNFMTGGQLRGIARQFGSGEYRINFYGPDPEDGRVKLRTWLTERVRLSLEEQTALDKARIAATAAPQSVGPNATDTANAVVAALSPAFNMIAKAIESVSQQGRADPFADMERMSTIMRNLMPPQAAPSEKTDSLGMLETVVTLAEKFSSLRGGGGEGEANFYDLAGKTLETFGKPIAEALAGAPRKANPAPAAPTEALPAPPPQENSAMPSTTSAVPPEAVNQLQKGLNFLLPLARLNADPYTYACVAYDQIPPEDMVELAAMPDEELLARMVETAPDVKNHDTWFREFIVELKKIAKGEDEVQPVPGA